jgi:hypothetical protein
MLIKYLGEFNVNLLAEELFVGVPELFLPVVTFMGIGFAAELSLNAYLDGVTIETPDDTHKVQIDSIVALHDKNKKSKSEKNKEKKESDLELLRIKLNLSVEEFALLRKA